MQVSLDLAPMPVDCVTEAVKTITRVAWSGEPADGPVTRPVG
jgi:hypothetical protein